jgi:hypothetical protein
MFDVAMWDVAMAVAMFDLAMSDLARFDVARSDLARFDVARSDLARFDLARSDLARFDVGRFDRPMADQAMSDPARRDLARFGVATCRGDGRRGVRGGDVARYRLTKAFSDVTSRTSHIAQRRIAHSHRHIPHHPIDHRRVRTVF